MDVDEMVPLDAVESQPHASADAGHLDAFDLERLLIELGTAVLRRRFVSPLPDLVVFGALTHSIGQRLRKLDLEPVGLRTHGQHLEDRIARVAHPLKTVPELADVAPVSRIPDAPDVELPVGTPHDAVHTGLETLCEAKYGPLILSIHLLHEHPLDAAVRDLAVDELVFVGSDVQEGRL